MSKEKRNALLAAEFVGGYGDRRKASGMLNFYESYVKFSVLFKQNIEIPLADIKNISVEAPEEVGKRVTVTRLVALGVLSLFLKKNVKESFIVHELNDGQEVIFKINGLDSMTVRGKLSRAIASLKS